MQTPQHTHTHAHTPTHARTHTLSLSPLLTRNHLIKKQTNHKKEYQQITCSAPALSPTSWAYPAQLLFALWCWLHVGPVHLSMILDFSAHPWSSPKYNFISLTYPTWLAVPWKDVQFAAVPASLCLMVYAWNGPLPFCILPMPCQIECSVEKLWRLVGGYTWCKA